MIAVATVERVSDDEYMWNRNGVSGKRIDLLAFTPFRLNRLAAEFSGALLADYQRFGIDVPGWRVLSTLGIYDEPQSATDVVRCTRTHKTRVSRAVAHMVELGLVERSEGLDRREIMLRLTAFGRKTYEELVPLMLAREEQLLSCLSPAQRSALDGVLATLETSLGLALGAGPAKRTGRDAHPLMETVES